jgi:hypothetical protein
VIIRGAKLSAIAAPTVSIGRCCCDATLPLTSTGPDRGGSNMSDGDTSNDNEIMAPAAMVTPLDASTCIACVAGIECPIRGTRMTEFTCTGAISSTMVPASNGGAYD